MHDLLIIKSKIKKNNTKNTNNNHVCKNALVFEEDKINQLYSAKNINPPFFKKIIILSNQLNTTDLEKIYNMCLLNGTIYFPEVYDSFFETQSSYKKISNKLYTFPNHRNVEFIVMGVQRGGTTSLSMNISKHPDIYMNNNKDPTISEVHFFDINWQKGIDWYRKQFNYNYNCVGEKTPSLIFLPYTFPLIQSVNPFVKIILILRNPVERAYSAWKLNTKNKNEHRTFEEAIAYELKHLKHINKTFFTIGNQYITRGFYYKQLKELLKWFPKQNIIVLISEKVKKNMNNAYNEIYQFLNLNIPQKNIKYDLEHISNNKTKINHMLYQRLLNLYKKDIIQLEQFIDLHTGWLD